MKKIVITIIGVAFFIGTIAGENLKQLSDWSNTQAIGFNLWTLFCLVGVPYIVFLQFKNKLPIEARNIKTIKEKGLAKIDKNKIVTGLVGLVLISFSFYWFIVRPENIRKECFVEAKNEAENMLRVETNLEINGYYSFTKGDYEKIKNKTYNECLLKNGMSK
ncbi:MAG: hypothetical protein WCK16_01915 [Candidatus Moraniibacteriota bacterium]